MLTFEELHLQNCSIAKMDSTVLGSFLLFQMMYKKLALLLLNAK